MDAQPTPAAWLPATSAASRDTAIIVRGRIAAEVRRGRVA